MRGTFFLEGTELILTTKKESWGQGDKIETTLEIKGDPQNQSHFTYGLYLCDLRKLKKKDKACLKEAVEVHSFSDLSTANEIPFTLSPSAPISDGATGLCLYVGDPNEPLTGGILQLSVIPWKAITEILSLFENFLRFKVKSIKNKKDKLAVVLVPPGSKEYGNIDGLTLSLQRNQEDGIKFDFEFKIKKLAYEDGQVQSKTEKQTIKKELSKKDIFSFGDALNQDGIINFFKEVLSETKKVIP
ncbi:MAG: hypothetical protein NXH75_16920 [Halobacteriovoraceae bacterium]|nr:hypothetical protein [Halobacteriovoraceae bacterium]